MIYLFRDIFLVCLSISELPIVLNSVSFKKTKYIKHSQSCNNKVLIIGREKLIQACGLGADVARTFSAFLIYDCHCHDDKFSNNREII